MGASTLTRERPMMSLQFNQSGAKPLDVNQTNVNQPDVQSFVSRLQHVNWEVILQRLIHSDEGKRFSLTQAKLAIQQYKNFLFLVHHYPQLRMVPNQDIDAIVHAHAADMAQFACDSQMLFGVPLCHKPGLGTRDTDRHIWLAAFKQTRSLFELHFGIGAMGYSQPACCEVFEMQMAM